MYTRYLVTAFVLCASPVFSNTVQHGDADTGGETITLSANSGGSSFLNGRSVGATPTFTQTSTPPPPPPTQNVEFGRTLDAVAGQATFEPPEFVEPQLQSAGRPQTSPVPLPAAFWLMGAGIGALAMTRRKKRLA